MPQDDPRPDERTKVFRAGAEPPPGAGAPDRTVPSLHPDAGATLPSVPGPDAAAVPPPSPSPAPRHDDDPLLGTILGGCRLDALVGRGAMGAVYKGWQLRLDRVVAVKVIRPELLADVRALKRFEVEARTIARFRSPHVITVHDVGTDEGLHFLVMEFVEGRNLRQIARERPHGRLGTVEAIALLEQACVGLQEAQRLGVLHRDIKPDNLLLDASGLLKIADFGIAKVLQDDLHMTMTSELTGTPLYMSPEQCRASAEIDFRSDMYSLGASFFYLLTGEPPFKASSIYQLIDTKTKLECLRLAQFLPEVDERHPLAQVIARMTALLPESRYQDYAELLADLQRVKADEPIALRTIDRPLGKLPPPLPKPKPASKGKGAADDAAAATQRERPRSRAAAAVAVVLLLGAGAAAAVWQPWRDTAAATDGTGTTGTAGTADAAGLGRDGERTAAGAADGTQDAATTQDAALATGSTAGDVRIPDPDPSLAGTATETTEAATDAAATGTTDDAAARAAEAALQREAESRRRNDALRTAIASVEQTLREAGPSSDLGGRLALDADDAELLGRRDALRRDVDHAVRTLDTLSTLRSSLRPVSPALPFSGVADYFARAAETLAPPTSAGPALRDWLQRTLSAEPAESGYVQRCTRELAKAATALQRPLDADADEAAIARREAELDELAAGRDVLLRTFDDHREAIVAACDDAALVAARAAIAPLREAARQRQLLANALAAVRAVPDLRTFCRERQRLCDELQARTTAFAGTTPSSAAQRDLDALRAATQRWLDAERHLADRLAALARGDLVTAASTAAAGADAPLPEDVTVAAVADGLRTAFGTFAASLDAAPLRDALSRGAAAIAQLPAGIGGTAAAAQRIALWQARLQALLDAVRDMEPIAGGTTAVHGKGTVEVAAFYCARTEVSVQQWREFLERLQRLPGVAAATTFEARRQALRSEYGVELPDATAVQQLLQRADTLRNADAALPVDAVTRHEAMLFAASTGRSLPTLAEWTLAALGPASDRHPFPWGTTWTDVIEDRNASDRFLLAVERGGQSWRNAKGARLHHLAGNVAEWLQPEAGATGGALAGGHYREPRSEQERHARGEPATARPEAAERGHGLRTVVRPADAFGTLWPLR